MRCSAHTRSGKPCKGQALSGTTVCRVHGGSAPQVKRAAVRNLAVARAQRMVELAGVDMSPTDHALDCLYRSRALMLFWGSECAVLEDGQMYTVNKLGDRKPHPAIVEYQGATERHMKFANLCAGMGIAERQIVLVERLGEQLSGIFERMMAAVEGLSDAQRLQAARALAAEVALLERPVIDGTAA